MKNALIFTFFCCLIILGSCATKAPPINSVPMLSQEILLPPPENISDTVFDISEENLEVLNDSEGIVSQNITITEKNPPDETLSANTPVEEEIALTEENIVEAPLQNPQDFTLAEPERALVLPEVDAPPPAVVNDTEPVIQLPEAAVSTETKVLHEPELPIEPSGGIWIETPSYPYIVQNSQPEPVQNTNPSRAVTLPLNRFLDIEYPGSGWIYLGENRNDALLAFSGRKLLGSDTLFTLRAKKSGTSVLHFYKQDLLNNNFIDDYLEVTVTAEPSSITEHVDAPLYAAVVPPKQEKKVVSNSQPSVVQSETVAQKPAEKTESFSPELSAAPVVTRQPTVIQTTESAPQVPEKTSSIQAPSSDTQRGEQAQNAAAAPQARQSTSAATAAVAPVQSTTTTNNLSPNELLKQAQDALKTNNARKAHEYVDAFFNKAVGNLDQGLFTRAQAYEAKTEAQNIRAAIDAYQQLMKQYPSSPLWKQADERVRYLNRFYFNIR